MKQELKLKSLLLLAAAGAFVVTGPMASAIRASDQAGNPPPGNSSVINEPAGAQSTDLYLRSAGRFSTVNGMIGTPVNDTANQPVGQVQDIIVNWRSGRASLVILSTQNGVKMVAVPISLFTAQPPQKELIFKGDQQTLLSAPAFSVEDLQTPGFMRQIYAYYGQPIPGYRRVAMAPEVYESAGAPIVPALPRFVTGHEQDMQANHILHQYQLGKGRAAQLDYYYWNNVRPDDFYAQYPATQEYRNISWGFREPAGAQPGPMNLSRSSELIGMSVQDSNGQVVGQIKDVVIDWSSGRIAYAVLDPGGISALNGKFLAIPPRALTRATTDNRTLVVSLDRHQLESAPAFDPANWPDPSRQDFISRVYRFYGQTPFWQGANSSLREPSGSESQEAPETPPAPPAPQQNQPETTPAPTTQPQSQAPANNESATPQTQNVQSDTDLNQRVTSAFQSDATLAPLSSGITITAQNGTVTLSGTVGSDSDKQQLESKAEQIAGSGKVNDQIQVKNGNQ